MATSTKLRPAFTKHKAYKHLTKCAKNPIDLTQDSVLTPERISVMSASACGLKLLFATERVDDEILTSLESLAEESGAVDKMKSMQNGDVINRIEGFPSEERSVLHTSMRSFLSPINGDGIASEASTKAQHEVEKLSKFMFNKTIGFTDMIMIGIGGSDLGPRAIYLALQAYELPGRKVHFISNVDPDDAACVLKGLDLNTTLVVVVSKSGTTLETLTNETLVRRRFEEANLPPDKHFIAVTGENSPMDDPKKYLASFYIWDYVGGRYSATSMVGGVMLAFALGTNRYIEILNGANDMDKIALNDNVRENLPLLSALLGIWNHNFLGYPTVAILPYSQALVRFTAHLQQCDMESNGKQITTTGKAVDYDTGPIVWGEPGTNGQHSFYQLIHQGTPVVPCEFIGFTESQYSEDMNVKGTTSQEKLLANLLAQSMALAIGQKHENPNKCFPGNRPNRILLAKKLTPYTMGALFAYYEHKVAFQGFIWDINSFDQEGVQLGKTLATRILQIFSNENADFPLGEALTNMLKLCRNGWGLSAPYPPDQKANGPLESHYYVQAVSCVYDIFE